MMWRIVNLSGLLDIAITMSHLSLSLDDRLLDELAISSQFLPLSRHFDRTQLLLLVDLLSLTLKWRAMASDTPILGVFDRSSAPLMRSDEAELNDDRRFVRDRGNRDERLPFLESREREIDVHKWMKTGDQIGLRWIKGKKNLWWSVTFGRDIYEGSRGTVSFSRWSIEIREIEQNRFLFNEELNEGERFNVG